VLPPLADASLGADGWLRWLGCRGRAAPV